MSIKKTIQLKSDLYKLEYEKLTVRILFLTKKLEWDYYLTADARSAIVVELGDLADKRKRLTKEA